MIATYTNDAENIVVHYDTEAAEPATRFVIWLEGDDKHVIAKDGEFPGAVWERVCAEVRRMRHNLLMQEYLDSRQRMSRGLVRGNRHRAAHVYADIEPTREQVAGHVKEWMTWTLWQLACPHRNKNGTERVAALCALADLFGLNQPPPMYVTLPPNLLELVEAELARRKGQ